MFDINGTWLPVRSACSQARTLNSASKLLLKASQFLASEDGPWASDTVSYSYTNGLRGGLTLLQPSGSSWTQSYGYDAANRLKTVTSVPGAFTYTYKGPDSTGVSPGSVPAIVEFSLSLTLCGGPPNSTGMARKRSVANRLKV